MIWVRNLGVNLPDRLRHRFNGNASEDICSIQILYGAVPWSASSAKPAVKRLHRAPNPHSNPVQNRCLITAPDFIDNFCGFCFDGNH